MNRLRMLLAIPLTIILLATVTKWWFVIPEDAPDTQLYGFPFPFVCNGWHTSLSLQFFVLEFIADILVYYIGVNLLLYLVNRFFQKINYSKGFLIILWVISGFFMLVPGLWLLNPDNLFFVSRPFEMEVEESGFKFIF